MSEIPKMTFSIDFLQKPQRHTCSVDEGQRLIPSEGLETHRATSYGPFMEEAVDSQMELEKIFCSGEMCCSKPSTLAS